jgi:hypothetical protein
VMVTMVSFNWKRSLACLPGGVWLCMDGGVCNLCLRHVGVSANSSVSNGSLTPF